MRSRRPSSSLRGHPSTSKNTASTATSPISHRERSCSSSRGSMLTPLSMTWSGTRSYRRSPMPWTGGDRSLKGIPASPAQPSSGIGTRSEAHQLFGRVTQSCFPSLGSEFGGSQSRLLPPRARYAIRWEQDVSGLLPAGPHAGRNHRRGRVATWLSAIAGCPT